MRFLNYGLPWMMVSFRICLPGPWRLGAPFGEIRASVCRPAESGKLPEKTSIQVDEWYSSSLSN